MLSATAQLNHTCLHRRFCEPLSEPSVYLSRNPETIVQYLELEEPVVQILDLSALKGITAYFNLVPNILSLIVSSTRLRNSQLGIYFPLAL